VATTIESLTRGLPEEFNIYLNYCRNLKFEERPDYNYMRKIFKDLMYKNNYEFDYQYDWVLKKSGQKVNEDDYVDVVKKGNIAAAQGKEEEKKQPINDFGEERKENRANIGQQVMNGSKNIDTRQASATKKRPPVAATAGPAATSTNPATNNQRYTSAAGWAKGQLPVAMQQQKPGQTSNSAYGQGTGVRNNSQTRGRHESGQPFGIPTSTNGGVN